MLDALHTKLISTYNYGYNISELSKLDLFAGILDTSKQISQKCLGVCVVLRLYFVCFSLIKVSAHGNNTDSLGDNYFII